MNRDHQWFKIAAKVMVKANYGVTCGVFWWLKLESDLSKGERSRLGPTRAVDGFSDEE